ncbi:MAG: radical SAM protein [Dehalogenimonas sp.]
MNLVLTRQCSNSCPYCFEIDERQRGKQGTISMENLEIFANWARISRLPYLSLLGGEPFLHPKLAEIVDLFRRVCPGTSLRILTGGVFNKDLLNGLSIEGVSLVFNINEPRDYRNPKHFNKVLHNVGLALRKGFIVSLGFNVWRLDFDPSFIPDLAYRFGLTNFAWTVANPIQGCESKVVERSKFPELAKRCFLMLQEGSRRGLEAILDCPLPLCFFNDTELAWVRQYHPDTACGMGVCKPVLDITPELDVIRCFALSKSVRLKVTDFNSEGDIEDWFVKHLDTPLLDHGSFKDCGQCQHFQLGRCYGGCLGWRNEFQEDNQSTLEQKITKAIEAGDYNVALSLYNSGSFWSRNYTATFNAAIAAYKIGDAKAAYALAIKANHMARDPDFARKIAEFISSLPFPNTLDRETGLKETSIPEFRHHLD